MFASHSTPDLRLELAALHRESFVWALHCCRGDADARNTHSHRTLFAPQLNRDQAIKMLEGGGK